MVFGFEKKTIINRDVTFEEDELLGLEDKTSGETMHYDVKQLGEFQEEKSQETKARTEETSVVQQNESTSDGQQHESTTQGELTHGWLRR